MVLKNSHTSKDTKKFCFLCVVNRSEIEGLAAEAVRAFKERGQMGICTTMPQDFKKKRISLDTFHFALNLN